MHVTGERLLAVVDDLDGAARVEREERGVDLHRDVLATAERAPDTGEVHPHPLGLEPEARRDLAPVDMQPLRRDMDVDSAFAVGNREARLGTEEGLILDSRLVGCLDRDGAAGIGVAVADDDGADDVRPRIVAVAVAHRRPVGVELRLLRRALHVGDRFERLVLDADRLGGTTSLLGVLGGDERHRLAVVADPVDREHGLVAELEAIALVARDVLVGEDGVDARHLQRGGEIDGANARMRVRASDGVAPEHPGRAQVTRVGELALDLRSAVLPNDALPDPSGREPARRDRQLGRGRAATSRHPRPPAAAMRTASKIFS